MGTTVQARPTYRQALQVREFRALFLAQLLSLLGDRAAAVALAVLVYARSSSALLTAAVFALLYLPHLFAAPLSTVADRCDRRAVMISCDVGRGLLVLLMVVPGVPLAALLALLAVVVLLEAPFEAARGAVTPEVLGDDLYPVGVSLATAVHQISQVLGALGGAALLLWLSPQSLLLLNAATFLVSAWLLRTRMQPHPVLRDDDDQAPADALQPGGLSGLTRRVVSDVTSTARLVRGDSRLCRWMLLAWLIAAVGVLPEGLAGSLAADLGHGPLVVGLLIAAGPAGTTLGALMIGRWSERRRELVLLPLTGLSLAALLPTAVIHDPYVVVPLWIVSGIGASALAIAATFFMLEVPPEHRGRVGGLMSSGLMGVQGLALLVGGALADQLPSAVVVTLCAQLGLAGLVALVLAQRREARDEAARRAPSPRPVPLPVAA